MWPCTSDIYRIQRRACNVSLYKPQLQARDDVVRDVGAPLATCRYISLSSGPRRMAWKIHEKPVGAGRRFQSLVRPSRGRGPPRPCAEACAAALLPRRPPTRNAQPQKPLAHRRSSLPECVAPLSAIAYLRSHICPLRHVDRLWLGHAVHDASRALFVAYGEACTRPFPPTTLVLGWRRTAVLPAGRGVD